MTEFRIVWWQCPTRQHTQQILFVEARDAEMARAVATDHIERVFGIGWFTVTEVTPYLRPQHGKVVPA